MDRAVPGNAAPPDAFGEHLITRSPSKQPSLRAQGVAGLLVTVPEEASASRPHLPRYTRLSPETLHRWIAPDNLAQPTTVSFP